MTTITRRFVFDAAHRVLGHQGKCRHLHGHRYVAEVTCTADKLDELGMVIDFSVIKDKVGGWINENWDHNLLLNADDPLLIDLDEDTNGREPYHCYHNDGGPDASEDGFNPTVENMAKELFVHAVLVLQGTKVDVTNVRLWETENCFADYNGEDVL